MFLPKNSKLKALIKKYINFDYIRIANEGKLSYICASRIERCDEWNRQILIMNTCLIGDFVATLPAIYDFTQRNPWKKIDIIVTSPLKELVEKVKGINKVYVAKSATNRTIENGCGTQEMPEAYDEIIILRTSPDVLENIVPRLKANKVTIVTPQVTRYTFSELLKNNIIRKRPKQWKDFNFELLWWKPHKIAFNDIFDSGDIHFQFELFFPTLSPEKKKIMIHTWASWHMMQWSNKKWIELLKRLHATGKFELIFIGGSDRDREDFHVISAALDFPVFSLIWQINLLELTLALRWADYFLGIDSGPGNIAHLVELRSLIIYWPGPHTFMSDDPEDVIIDKSNGRWLTQRYLKLKKGFIDKITVDEVFREFQKMHNRQQRGHW